MRIKSLIKIRQDVSCYIARVWHVLTSRMFHSFEFSELLATHARPLILLSTKKKLSVNLHYH